MTTLAIGQSAPAFSLIGIDNKKHGLNQTGAKLTLAIFFKTTCPTCALSFPYLEKFHRAYADAGLAVWGISQDGMNSTNDFASKHGSTFPILIDADLRVSHAYDPEFVPTMFLIDASGKIVDRVLAFDKAGLNRVASETAQVLGKSVSIVAPDNDGNPPFKPG
jgi:peroxiredoxin